MWRDWGRQFRLPGLFLGIDYPFGGQSCVLADLLGGKVTIRPRPKRDAAPQIQTLLFRVTSLLADSTVFRLFAAMLILCEYENTTSP